MRAVVHDNGLRVVYDYPVPKIRSPGSALVLVQKAGICRTDLELLRGYKGFQGVLGHEFVGIVAQCDDSAMVGKRVVGEINIGCGTCGWCKNDMARHCPDRSVLGILNHDGCMAEYCVLPLASLLEVPAGISNDRAVFTEPLSAATEIIEQIDLSGSERAVVLGDGRLGILCAWILTTVLADVTLQGHHPQKLALAPWRHLKITENASQYGPKADLVVEATGRGAGIIEAMNLCRPRGTIVLKSTGQWGERLNLTPLVVNEQTLVGSRCGRFSQGLHFLSSYPDMPLERLITARYPLDRAIAAFAHAAESDAVKILFEISNP